MTRQQDEAPRMQPVKRLRPDKCRECQYHFEGIKKGECCIDPEPIDRSALMPACRFGCKGDTCKG